MPYSAKDATNTLFGYLNIDVKNIEYVQNTNNRGFIYTDGNGNRSIIFIYPISHKADNSKNFFDTRDSGARERGITWNYAIEHDLKYFCFAVHDQVEKYKDYIFSLESDETRVETVSGTTNGTRSGPGTQVVIPNDYIPSMLFDRIRTQMGFYIAVIHRDYIADYIEKFDNRPYMSDGALKSIGKAAFLSPEWFEIADEVVKPTPEVVYITRCDNHNFARNRIVFGAPGTGKSFTINEESKELLEDNDAGYERVTFHPDYSYANFVGTYKPVPVGASITYEYVPGPFMRVYVKALKNARTDNAKPFLLIIEEINRANVAGVFGDIFQLLDRDDDEISEYPIQASEDIKKYLVKELGGNPEDYSQIRIPDNMFIWATMNSADQGVFPIDTAFKRRWDFTYIGINASEGQIRNKTVVLGTGDKARMVDWNELRHAINDRLSTFKINEDKLLGPYFLSKKVIPQEGNIDRNTFIEAFKNKVLMYLFDDAAKQKRPSLFADGLDTMKYSVICDVFERNGVFAFCTDISSRFTTIPTEAEETDQTVQEGESE